MSSVMLNSFGVRKLNFFCRFSRRYWSELTMSRLKTTVIAFSIAATLLAVLPSEANADGPLRRWLRGFRTPKNTACAPANPYNLQPGQCMKTCQQTCTRTVVNYVPCTAYRTVSKQVPVTSYRPETTTDPATGCTTTCMKPCTSYTTQVQRVPYTTYRPVYRQETYKVPVTTITNNCATGGCNTCGTAMGAGGCDTCAVGQTMATPQPYYVQPEATANPTPADMSPGLDGKSSQVPMPQIKSDFNSEYQTYYRSGAIAVSKAGNASPTQQRWGYSPVRLASYQPAVQQRAQSQTRSYPQPIQRTGWVEVK